MQYFGDETANINKHGAEIQKRVSSQVNMKDLSQKGEFDLAGTRNFFQKLGEKAGENSVENRFADRVDNMIAMLGDLCQMLDEKADPAKREKAGKRFVSHCNAAFGSNKGQGGSTAADDFFSLLQNNGNELMQMPEVRFVFQMLGVGAELENYSAAKGHQVRVTKTANTVERFSQETEKYNTLYGKAVKGLRKEGLTVESLQNTVKSENKEIKEQTDKLALFKRSTVRDAMQNINEECRRELTAYLDTVGGVQKQTKAAEQRIESLQDGLGHLNNQGRIRFADLSKNIKEIGQSVMQTEEIVNKTERLNRKIKKGEKHVRDTKRIFDNGLKEKGIFEEYYADKDRGEGEPPKEHDEHFKTALQELNPQKEAMEKAQTGLDKLLKLKSDKINLQEQKEFLAQGKARLNDLMQEKTELSNAYSELFTGKKAGHALEWDFLEKMGKDALENALTLKEQLDATHDTKQIGITAMRLQKRVNATSAENYQNKIEKREKALEKTEQSNQKHSFLLNLCNRLFKRQKQLGTAEELIKAKCQKETQKLPTGQVQRELSSFADRVGDMLSPEQKDNKLFKLMNVDLKQAAKCFGNPNATNQNKTDSLKRLLQSADRLAQNLKPAPGEQADEKEQSNGVLLAVALHLVKYSSDTLKTMDQMQHTKAHRNCLEFAQQENVFDRKLSKQVFQYQLNQNVKKSPTVGTPAVINKPLQVNQPQVNQPQVNPLQLSANL